jgi:hypothetical protein
MTVTLKLVCCAVAAHSTIVVVHSGSAQWQCMVVMHGDNTAQWQTFHWQGGAQCQLMFIRRKCTVAVHGVGSKYMVACSASGR